MTSCFDHPKFKSSSARVQETCRSICYMLEAERFTASNAGRDGFTFRNARGLSVRIDPKIDALRIYVGHDPRPPVPPELVHPGRQPDWIVVTPEHETLTISYLRALVRTA